MPLQQFCSSSNKRASSSNAPFISPAIHAQEVYDAKFPQRSMERCASQTSTLSFSKDICRICHCEGDNDTPLIAPCYCAGSLRFVHQGCLQQWIKSSDTKCCELCKFPFLMHSKVKPFRKWERLDINGIERRKILFSVLFHIIAITCVVWSLYVLIERTSQEVQNGELEWPFWTKLIVVAIGFTGSIVFMYVQCKMYIHLYRRWRAFNRVIYIQNAPEKMVLNDVETSKSRTDFQSESEKPFLALAVITSAPGSNLMGSTGSGVPNTNPGSCCTASSSPPGALWSDEGSPQLGNYPRFKDVSSSHRLAEEADTLITTSEVSSRNSGRSSSSCDPSRCLLSDDQGSERKCARNPKEKGSCFAASAKGGHKLSMTDSISSTCSSSSSDSRDNESFHLKCSSSRP